MNAIDTAYLWLSKSDILIKKRNVVEILAMQNHFGVENVI